MCPSLPQTDRAVQLLLETSADNPSYYCDSLKACLVTTITSSGPSQSTIKLVATNMIANGKLAGSICVADSFYWPSVLLNTGRRQREGVCSPGSTLKSCIYSVLLTFNWTCSGNISVLQLFLMNLFRLDLASVDWWAVGSLCHLCANSLFCRLPEGVQLLCLIDKAADACRYLQTYGEWNRAAWLAKVALLSKALELGKIIILWHLGSFWVISAASGSFCVCLQVRLSPAESSDVLKRWAEHLCSPQVNQKSKAILVLLSLGCFSKVGEMLHRYEARVFFCLLSDRLLQGSNRHQTPLTSLFLLLSWKQYEAVRSHRPLHRSLSQVRGDGGKRLFKYPF